MKTNIGTLDRIMRLVVAAVIAVLYFAHQISGTSAIIGLVLASLFVITSFIKICPLYAVFGISTCPKNS